MGLLMDAFRYSALSTALRCNRLYQYLYVEKLKADEPESFSLHFGTALHCGINSLIEGENSDSFRAYWDSVKGLQFEKSRYGWDALGDMGEVFLDRFKRLHLKNFKKHTAEQKLATFSPGGVALEGTPDFIGEYMGVLSVVDFKTASSAYPEGRIQASDQLILYAYMAQKCLGIKPLRIVYIVFIKGKEPRIQTQVLDITEELIASRMANIEQHCQELAKKTTFPQNFNACFDYNRKCSFFEKCHGPKGQTESE
jgi:hypothetical protein